MHGLPTVPRDTDRCTVIGSCWLDCHILHIGLARWDELTAVKVLLEMFIVFSSGPAGHDVRVQSLIIHAALPSQALSSPEKLWLRRGLPV